GRAADLGGDPAQASEDEDRPQDAHLGDNIEAAVKDLGHLCHLVPVPTNRARSSPGSSQSTKKEATGPAIPQPWEAGTRTFQIPRRVASQGHAFFFLPSPLGEQGREGGACVSRNVNLPREKVAALPPFPVQRVCRRRTPSSGADYPSGRVAICPPSPLVAW